MFLILQNTTLITENTLACGEGKNLGLLHSKKAKFPNVLQNNRTFQSSREFDHKNCNILSTTLGILRDFLTRKSSPRWVQSNLGHMARFLG